MRPALPLLTLLLVTVTLLPLWRNPHWLVRGMDFPRLQLAVLAVLLLVAQLVVLDLGKAASWLLISFVLLCLAWHLWWIAPYTRLWPVEVEAARDHSPDRRLRTLTANVLMSNRDSGALLDLVRRHRPDVLVTLESDGWWQSELDVLEAEMPHTIKCPLDNYYGMHVYSRLPLEEPAVEFLVEDDIPSMHALLRLRTGDSVRLHVLHPAPPSPTENPESEERDAELVIVARSVADSEQPVIVTGDLNDVSWSPTTRLFRKLSGLLDPRVGRGLFNTFHVSYPFARWPLDHLFHSEQFTLLALERLPPIGSDHFPLLAELVFTPVLGADQDGLAEPGASDRSWAESIAQEEGVSEEDVPRPGRE